MARTVVHGGEKGERPHPRSAQVIVDYDMNINFSYTWSMYQHARDTLHLDAYFDSAKHGSVIR